MGFMDSIKEALGGERDDAPADATVPTEPTAPPRHLDHDAPPELTYGIEETGGKHAARD